MSLLRAIIFDLDGLLVDSETISLKVYQRILQVYGYKITKEIYAQNYSGRSTAKNIYSLINNFDLPLTIEEGISQSLSMEKNLLKKGVSLKAGALELLKFLQKNGYRIALASSSTPERALYILKINRIDCYFNSFTFGNEVLKSKPNPEIFIRAQTKLQLPVDACLVLEDSEAGIQAANSAKMSVICIPDMRYPQPRYAKMTKGIYGSLSDVLTYLKNNDR
ncbi:HAD family hydrolase [Liquorilactobacillus satsumensis]|uniref:HAD family hydrolase n=1 Tax=Liquorilactobacillus satsumensis TaxID=259059 RepID=UPI001E646AD1|nr:HAD family phosphatase [Liquorilactobacillus satsumensis]